MTGARLVLAAALALAAVACTVTPRSDDFRCAGPADCTDGRQCVSGWCVATSAIDGGIDSAVGGDAMPDALDCPAACTRCVDGTCEIECSGDGACATGVACPDGVPCHVVCSGSSSCAGAVDCAAATSCDIDCNGVDACGGDVTCGPGTCDIDCPAAGACAGALDCSDACECDTHCGGAGACGSTVSCPGPSSCRSGGQCTSAPNQCQRC
ncbi:MAG: hypothetical protein H6708_18565 [Kofleriaceae bacterium]|nr:hypothetical protein [Myxococcales bacterium]MCB9562411.1 hypothetical protein [Kofleriaceae bacterium]